MKYYWLLCYCGCVINSIFNYFRIDIIPLRYTACFSICFFIQLAPAVKKVILVIKKLILKLAVHDGKKPFQCDICDNMLSQFIFHFKYFITNLTFERFSSWTILICFLNSYFLSNILSQISHLKSFKYFMANLTFERFSSRTIVICLLNSYFLLNILSQIYQNILAKYMNYFTWQILKFQWNWLEFDFYPDPDRNWVHSFQCFGHVWNNFDRMF